MEELGDATEYHHTANRQVNEPTARLVRSAFKAQKPLGSRENKNNVKKTRENIQDIGVVHFAADPRTTMEAHEIEALHFRERGPVRVSSLETEKRSRRRPDADGAGGNNEGRVGCRRSRQQGWTQEI